MTAKAVVQTYEAYGGPEYLHIAPDGHEAGPTDAGEYRVAYVGRHASKRYPTWSKIPWGTPLKEEAGEVLVRVDGWWQRLRDVVDLTREKVEQYHHDLYRVRKVPNTWVFNDFGHATCFLYKDLNGNGRRDRKEEIHGEFIHTTPLDEAMTALGREVALGPSHGCIHVKPRDIDDMVKRGFLRKNTKVVVHPYSARRVVLPASPNARPPFEMHFFPSMKQILVIGTARGG